MTELVESTNRTMEAARRRRGNKPPARYRVITDIDAESPAMQAACRRAMAAPSE